MLSRQSTRIVLLQQSLPFTVCAEGCETAKEQSDDEVRTSQVPERSEGKTKVIKQQPLPFTVLKLFLYRFNCIEFSCCNSTYRLRYWNRTPAIIFKLNYLCCNNTYRLRYWNAKPIAANIVKINKLQQHLPFTVLERFKLL